jgi:uncharacterized membrane protein (UPF0136 family)
MRIDVYPEFPGLESSSVMSTACIDRVVGEILAGWRYDISGLAPDMRSDYETHLAECAHCRSRQVLHRTVDIGLMIVASVSAVVFLVAFGAVRHFSPRHALVLELIALAGFLFFSVVWLIVAVATPAPVVVADVARIQARRLHDKLPSNIREKLPDITQEFLKER